MRINICHQCRSVKATDFVARYRHIKQVEALCGDCPNYGKVWSCPPFIVPFDFTPFLTTILIGTVITLPTDSVQAEYTTDKCRLLMTEAIDIAWRQLLPFLYTQERAHTGSRIFTGRCRLCQPEACARTEGLPCRRPAQQRSSLEAVGFDVVSAARDVLGIEMQWATENSIPSSISLITALFSPQSVDTLPLPKPLSVTIANR